MTSALFTDGINHSLVELEIPNGFILSSLFGGYVAQPVPLMALTLFFFSLLSGQQIFTAEKGEPLPWCSPPP